MTAGPSRRHLPLAALLPIALAAVAGATTPSPKAIVLMVIDDWGWADSAINPGVCSDIPMTNFEALSGEVFGCLGITLRRCALRRAARS